MAFSLALRQVGDYYIMDGGTNLVPGTPKSGWTPVKGQLVVRDTSVDNGFDLAADTEVPVGIVEVAPHSTTSPATIALFVPGVTIILPFDATTGTDLGDMIQASATGLVDVGTANFQRSEVKAVASGGIGRIIDLAPYGSAGGTTTTATVEIMQPAS